MNRKGGKMYKSQKRGQAAMEFLMTYGWAILAAIIAIGVLAYFGVFNPSNLAGSSATMGPPMNVDQNAWNIVDGGAGNDIINMEILQNSGESITVTASSITLTSGATGTCTDSTWTNPWSSGTEQTFAFDCAAATVWAPGDTIAGDITITYTAGGSTISQQATGTFRGTSQ
jgi:uncharacterized protein (UPF0333 family)